jgi:hypothetical protein
MENQNQCWKFRGGYNYSNTHRWKGSCDFNLFSNPTDWPTARREIVEGGIEGFGLSNDKPRVYKTLNNDWQGSVNISGYVIAPNRDEALSILKQYEESFNK